MAPDRENRFISDTSSELESNYNPISGYQSIPLVSLEEAVQSIIPFLPDVMTYVDTAKERCTKNTKLTVNESAAVYLYTMESPFYTTINKRLRNENRSDLEPSFAYLKLFIIALWKLPPCITTVWRGVYGVVVSGFDENDIHVWWSINSCSRHLDLAHGFTGENGTLFCIESIYGRDICLYSEKKTEDEIVLMPGTRLRVKGKLSNSSGVPTVHLQECEIAQHGKHVMLSYHEKNQSLVTEIGRSLRSKNIPVWFNEQGNIRNIRHSLAIGVENAAVVFCFLTADYQASIDCKFELQYAMKRSRKIIPCTLSDPRIWKASGWLGSVTDRLKYIDYDVFTDPIDIDYITDGLIHYIQEMNSFSKQVLSTTTDKPSYLYELVKYEYLRKSRIERFMNPAKSFPIEQSYINLVIVKAKDQQEKEKQMHGISHDTAVLGTYEDIYGVKTSIHVNDIFETCETHAKQVLVFGRAGIGKSTFCQFAAYQWAIGECWPQYELLVVIPLRNLKASEYAPLQNGNKYSLVDIVIREVFDDDLSKEDKELLKGQFDAEKVLWVLDGYDEIAQNIPSHLDHLLKKLLKTPHHILTSRPYLNTLSYKVQMEIIGFTDANIQQYVKQFFDQMKDELENMPNTSEAMLKHIQSNTRLWGVAHIPLMLELISTVWSNEDWSKTKTVTTTELYTTMLQWLCRRYLKSQGINIQTMSKNKLYQHSQKQLTFLSILAFNAIKQNQIILPPELLEQAFEEADISLEDQVSVLNIGVLKSFNKQGTGTQIETDKDHYFVHLSFQEYFAAQYLVNQLKGSSMANAVEFIKYQKYNQRYELMFTFIAGLLHENQIDSTCHIFWNAIQEEPAGFPGVRHMQLIISCLEAVYERMDTPRRADLLQRIAQMIEYHLCRENGIVDYHISTSLQTAQSVICDEIIINVLIDLLQSDDFQVKKRVFSFIVETGISNPSPKLRTIIASFVDDEDYNVRKRACYALGKIGEKAATKEVIHKLASALTDANDLVRRSACDALGNIGEKAATKEVIDKLLGAMTDANEWVRRSACDALGKIGEKAATKEVIDKLLGALTDANKSVRRSACDTLGKIGEKAATKEVIHKLASALTDANELVRRSACDALGKIGEKAATKEVIDKLLGAMTDENYDVRSSATYALGMISETAATKEVIDKLLGAMTDENYDVRSSAIYALGMISETAATKEVIDKLLGALTDTNELVRRSACDALGMISETAATKEVIDKLLGAMTDENHDVRSSATYALGNIGEKAATKEVIDKLLGALTDANELVRCDACDTLGKIGEKAATKEVIDKLLGALTDANEWVRRSACDTLGKIGEKAATKEVIDKLLGALTDANDLVRRSACDALGNIGGKAATKEVIDKLLGALTDANELVRCDACDALGKIGEKAATKEVIDKLLGALTDANELVRCDACDALGKIGEKAATKEVIDKLLGALTDANKWVRRSACDTLGEIGEKAVTTDMTEKILKLHSNSSIYGLTNWDSLLWKILPVSTLMKLNPEVLSDCYLREGYENMLNKIAIEQMLNIWLQTENYHWLLIITRALLLRAGAVVLKNEKVIVYEKKEPVEICVPSKKLREELRQALLAQREQLSLSFEN